MNDQFRDRLADIKAAIQYSDKLRALKFSMSEHKKALEQTEVAAVSALDKWHEDESTDPKPVVPDFTADKAKLDKASGTIDALLTSMDNTNKLLDQAATELGS